MRSLTTALVGLVIAILGVLWLIWQAMSHADPDVALLKLAALLSLGALTFTLGLAVTVLRQVSLFTRALEAKALARCGAVGRSLPSVPKPLADVTRLVDDLVFDIRHSAERAGSLADDQAHALRTPLATMKVAMPVISRSMQAGDLRVARAVDAVERAIEDMVATIDSTWREAHAIAALLARERARVELGSVVRAAIDEARDEAAPRNVCLRWTSDGSVIVAANLEALTAALTAIVSSAVDASPDDTEINIAIGSRDGIAFVDVQDSAPNSPEPAALFSSSLKRKDPASTSRWPGLYHDLRTVEAFGGTLSACRNTLGGLTVTMTLPVLDEER